MAVQIQLRRDTAANWAATNSMLVQGEPGLETDTGKIKYGDGITTWNGLAYHGANPILETAQIISTNLTLSSGSNGISAGPVQVAATYAVTVPANSTWVIL